ncbi:MAG: hypothetical protein FGM16_04175 [Flavobacterium sp.]|nr:hypothetical protein [Flavobacterium sp.]
MAVQRKKTTKLSGQAVMGEIKTLAMLTGGVVIGSVGGKMIDKVLNVDASATGFNVKAMARPIVLLGVGAAGNLMLKDPNMKMLATGVGAAGMLSGVKVFLKKDLLAGLSDFNMSGIDGLGEPAVYREPMNLSIERYNPDLPALSSPTSFNPEDYASNVEGIAEEDLSYIEII